jgi:AraC-like DNA-binding protein/quercetin dioxygenase-like cupin family protein
MADVPRHIAIEERLRLPPTRSEVVTCGYLTKVQGHGTRDRDLRAYALVYLLDGGGYYSDETTPQRRVSAGDVLVLFPGKRHSYDNGDQPRWVEIYVVFRGGVFEQLEKDGLLSRERPVVRPGVDQALVDAFDGVHAAFTAGDWRSASSLVARTHLLCTEVVRLDQAAQPEAGEAERACALLGETLHRPLDLERVADRLGMGYERFRKFFTRSVGMPPARWRQLKRVESARRLLVEGDLPLADIAEQLGYCDEYFFNRQFKRFTGLSPARYRRDFSRTR